MALDVTATQLNQAVMWAAGQRKVGRIHQVYADNLTQELSFVSVIIGTFGSRETYVPLHEATWAEHGLSVPYSKQTIKQAPSADADRALDAEDEQLIYDYYAATHDVTSDEAVEKTTEESDPH